MNHFQLHQVNCLLLRFESDVSFFNHLSHKFILWNVKVAALGFFNEAIMLHLIAIISLLLFLQSQIFLIVFFIVVNAFFLLTLALEHIINHGLYVSRLGLLLNLSPVLHDGILEFDPLFVFVKFIFIIFIWLSFVVVKDVIESQWVLRSKYRRLDLLLRPFQVLPPAFDFIELVVAEDENRNRR